MLRRNDVFEDFEDGICRSVRADKATTVAVCVSLAVSSLSYLIIFSIAASNHNGFEYIESSGHGRDKRREAGCGSELDTDRWSYGASFYLAVITWALHVILGALWWCSATTFVANDVIEGDDCCTGTCTYTRLGAWAGVTAALIGIIVVVAVVASGSTADEGNAQRCARCQCCSFPCACACVLCVPCASFLCYIEFFFWLTTRVRMLAII